MKLFYRMEAPIESVIGIEHCLLRAIRGDFRRRNENQFYKGWKRENVRKSVRALRAVRSAKVVIGD